MYCKKQKKMFSSESLMANNSYNLIVVYCTTNKSAQNV